MSGTFSLKKYAPAALLVTTAMILVSIGFSPKNQNSPTNFVPPDDSQDNKTELVLDIPPENYFLENKDDMIDLTGLYSAPKEDLLTIQTYAQMAGYVLDVDGLNGPHTKDFVKNFQTAHGIPATGYVDHDYTLKLIKEEAVKADISREEVLIGFRFAVIDEFEKLLGIQEEGCNNCGPEIETFLRSDLYTGLKMVGRAAPPGPGANWCAGAISHGFENLLPGLIDYTLNAKAAAYDHLPTDGLMEQGIKANAFYPYDGPYTPRPGDIIVFDRGSAWNTWRGHAGIVKSVGVDGHLKTLEGNVVNQYYADNNFGRYRWTERYPDQFREVDYSPRDLVNDKVIGFINITQLIERRFAPEVVVQLTEQYNFSAYLAGLQKQRANIELADNKADSLTGFVANDDDVDHSGVTQTPRPN